MLTNRATKVLSVTYTYDLISFALSLAAAGTCDSELLAAELQKEHHHIIVVGLFRLQSISHGEVRWYNSVNTVQVISVTPQQCCRFL